ncbi:MAG: acyl carrier protein [Acidobacteriota bacterium]|nr:acyl carrier protein [Acidobacteriota bacterium]
MSREAELREILARQSRLAVDGIGLDDDLVQKLGLDSLAALRVLAAAEKRFRLRFPDERLGELRTLRDVLDLIAAMEKEGQR